MQKLKDLGLWDNLYQPEYKDLRDKLGDNNFNLSFNGRTWVCLYQYDKGYRWHRGRSRVSAESALVKTIIKYYETSSSNNISKSDKLE